MALIKFKPTSPGTRTVVRIDRSHLHKGGPYEPLTVAQNKTGARNHFGRITTRHVGGGSRQKYRIIDFKRDKDGVAGTVERVEYDPNRTAHIALVLYTDGERRYIIATKGMAAGDEVRSGSDSPIKPGNAMALRHLPGRFHRAQRGTEARQGRPAGPQRRLLGAVHLPRRPVRLPASEVR